MPAPAPRKAKLSAEGPEKYKLEPWVVDSFLSSLNANRTMFSEPEPAQPPKHTAPGKPCD